MKATLAIGLFAGLGLFAGCASSDGPVDEQVNETAEATDERSQKLCCAEFTCPTNSDVFSIGCKTSLGGIGNAANRCRQACGQACDSGGLICDLRLRTLRDPLLRGLDRAPL